MSSSESEDYSNNDQYDSGSESSGSSDNDSELADMKASLSRVPFEKLMAIKNKITTTEQSTNSNSSQIKKKLSGNNSKPAKRENKNRPQEISAKKPVSRKRIVVETPNAYKSRDPRFDPLCGNFNSSQFEKSFSFLEDYRKSEIEYLKRQLVKEKNGEKKREMRLQLNKLKSRLDADKKKKRQQELERDWMKQEMELVKQGKKPFFLGRGMRKKLELVDKYNKITQQNTTTSISANDNQQKQPATDSIRVLKAMEKHRKKASSKDIKRLPFSVRRRDD